MLLGEDPVVMFVIPLSGGDDDDRKLMIDNCEVVIDDFRIFIYLITHKNSNNGNNKWIDK